MFSRTHTLSSPAGYNARRLLLAFFALLCLAGHAAIGATPAVSKEYQVKAAFLYNFTKFVEWPASRFPDDTSPIVIAVLGRNPFGDELAAIIRTRKVNGRELVVKIIASADEAATAHLLFVGADEETLLVGKMEPLQKAGVLTVGESPRFIASGGIINFTLETDKVRFQINPLAGQQAGLKISAQLLKLAMIVRK
ncbi:MAG: YfiR family protein [Opitutaceae bacterium]|jgi:hypothetical protein